MTDTIKILKGIELREEEVAIIKDFYPFIDSYISEIVDEVVAILAEDYEIVLTLKRNNLSVERAKAVFVRIFKFIFSHELDREFFETIKKVGLKHAEAGVHEQFVLQALSLFRNRIIRKLFDNNFRLSVKHILAINKIFDLVAIVMLSSYRDEKDIRNRAVIKFFGIRETLLERIVSEGKKLL